MILSHLSFAGRSASTVVGPVGSRIAKAALLAALCLSPIAAQSVLQTSNVAAASGGKELPPYLQCVPFARQLSGVQIYGDAHTWWDQAQSKYRRGNTPRKGAVMAFRPHRNMRLGHVAAVSRIIDSRTILLSHSNWSPINGRRGQIERDVKAVDVSPNNDWSSVRVWYHPLQALGKTAWPIHGFIYNERSDGRAPLVRTQIARAAPVRPARTVTSPAFTNAFAALGAPRPAIGQPSPAPAPQFSVRPRVQQARRNAPAPVTQQAARRSTTRTAARSATRPATRPDDQVTAAISRYE